MILGPSPEILFTLDAGIERSSTRIEAQIFDEELTWSQKKAKAMTKKERGRWERRKELVQGHALPDFSFSTLPEEEQRSVINVVFAEMYHVLNDELEEDEVVRGINGPRELLLSKMTHLRSLYEDFMRNMTKLREK